MLLQAGHQLGDEIARFVVMCIRVPERSCSVSPISSKDVYRYLSDEDVLAF